MVQTRLYRLFLQKAYFEKGMSEISVLRYAVLGGYLFGFWEGVAFTLATMAGCWVLGRFMYKKGIVLVEAEIGNQFNRFTLEMRERVKKRNTFK